MEYQIYNNTERSQLQAIIGNRVIGLIDYKIDQLRETVSITHTEVNPEFEGQGIAGKMTKALLEYIKEKQLKVIPICSYTKTYIDRHPDYQDLLS